MRGGKLYIISKQMYSGNGAPNFIRIAGVLWEILQKNSLVFFPGHIEYFILLQDYFMLFYFTCTNVR